MPADRHLGLLAFLLGALSSGPTRIRGLTGAPFEAPLLRLLAELGVNAAVEGGVATIGGLGLDGLRAPPGPLSVWEAAPPALLGLLAAQRFEALMPVGAPRSEAVLEPLGALLSRDAKVSQAEERGAHGGPTLRLGARQGWLAPCDYAASVPTSAAKEALLFSGLYASGPTLVREPLATRDHLERLLQALRFPVEQLATTVSLHPPADRRALAPFEFELPGDVSCAAPLLVAGQLLAGSHVSTRRTGLNPTRTGVLDLLRLFGGEAGITPQGDSLGEAFGELSSRALPLRGTTIGGELSHRLGEELPLAAVLAARARGPSELLELGVTEPDARLQAAALLRLLRGFGVEATEVQGGIAVRGRPSQPLSAAVFDAQGDAMLAMAATLLGLVADGESYITGVDAVGAVFPRFAGTLRALGAHVEVES